MKRIFMALAMVGAMLCLTPAGHAIAQTPDGKVKMTGKTIAAGVNFPGEAVF